MTFLPLSLCTQDPLDLQRTPGDGRPDVILGHTQVLIGDSGWGSALPIGVEFGHADGEFWARLSNTQGHPMLTLRASMTAAPRWKDLKHEHAPAEARRVDVSGKKLFEALKALSSEARVTLRAHTTQPSLPERSTPECGQIFECERGLSLERYYRAMFYPPAWVSKKNPDGPRIGRRKPGWKQVEGARCYHLGIARERDTVVGDLSAILETCDDQKDRGEEAGDALKWLTEDCSSATWVTVNFAAAGFPGWLCNQRLIDASLAKSVATRAS